MVKENMFRNDYYLRICKNYIVFFKKEHEHVIIGLTKFTQSRPPHCVLAGSSGTHNVCVCIYHENIKLMLNANDLECLTKDTNLVLKNYHDCIQAVVCTN